MGRSQVERNRRLGRPGEKGGRGGRQSNKIQDRTQKKPDLGDNSFRYQDDDIGHKDDHLDGSEWDFTSSANVYGSSHDVIGIPSYDDAQNTEYGMYEIDIGKLSACIDEMKTFEWMRLDNDRILKIFEDRFSGAVDDGKKTLAEWKASTIEDLSSTLSNINVTSIKNESNPTISTSTPIVVEDQHNPIPSCTNDTETIDQESDDEENLQGWLDDMIDT